MAEINDEEAKRKALEKLAGYDEESMQRILDTPGRITRAGIHAFQNDQPIMAAMGEQLKPNAPQAPSGADIAETFGQKHNVQNPYVLGGLATLADVFDPTMLVPGGIEAKAPRTFEALRGLSKVGDVSFPARHSAEGLKIAERLKQLGRVPQGSELQLGERMISKPMPGGPISAMPDVKTESTIRDLVGEDDLRSILSQFPFVNPEQKMLLKKK